MSTRAWHAASDYEADDAPITQDFFPGERIGVPLANRRARVVFKFGVLCLAVASGWALATGRVTLPDWVSFKTVSALLESKPKSEPAIEKKEPPPVQPLTSSDVGNAPGEGAGTPVAPVAATAGAPETQAPETEAADTDEAKVPVAAPLPPPKADPADPYQTRALAVGLHPDLSRVLLKRLTAADYRNAGTAIQTALAETADDALFTWPKTRKPDLAQFEVHFVPGATKECRRYVVTVAKDGWSTTALPMEKCGADLPRRRRG
jgi:hypothetical protein